MESVPRPSGTPVAFEPIVKENIRPEGEEMQKMEARRALAEKVGIELHEPNERENDMEDDTAEGWSGDYEDANESMDTGFAGIVSLVFHLGADVKSCKRERNTALKRMVSEIYSPSRVAACL